MCGITSPMGGACGVLWAPASKGSGAEAVMWECAAGTGLGIAILPVWDNGNSSGAHAPCTGRGSWVLVWDWTGCKRTVSGHDGMTVGIGWGWRVVRLDGQ